MSRFRGPRGLMVLPVLLCLQLAVGCSPPAGLRSENGASAADPHQVPFHDDGNRSGSSSPDLASGAPHSGQKPENGLPFRDSQSLPAGTMLTVRLTSPVSADDPGPSATFEATVDEPVVIEGNALVPRGANVEGRVEAARASKVKRHHSYLRLTLDSIDVAGKDLPVRTSSLFARGNTLDSDSSLGVITLEKGRRLTFRLAEPVYMASQQAVTGR